MKRQVALLGISSLIAAGLAAAPASATGRECTVPPGSKGSKPVVISDRYTRDDPLVIEFQYGVGLWAPNVDGYDDPRYWDLLVRGSKKASGLHMRAEWPVTYPSDIDLYLYRDEELVARSDAFNIPVFDDVIDQAFSYESYGAYGYEYIEGFRTTTCDDLSLITTAGRSVTTPVTLKIWLGPQLGHYDDL